MVKISASKLNELFAAISSKMPLYLPVDNTSGEADYGLWKEGTVFSSALNTNRSAKDFFIPQTENLMEFKMSGKYI